MTSRSGFRDVFDLLIATPFRSAPLYATIALVSLLLERIATPLGALGLTFILAPNGEHVGVGLALFLFSMGFSLALSIPRFTSFNTLNDKSSVALVDRLIALYLSPADYRRIVSAKIADSFGLIIRRRDDFSQPAGFVAFALAAVVDVFATFGVLVHQVGWFCAIFAISGIVQLILGSRVESFGQKTELAAMAAQRRSDAYYEFAISPEGGRIARSFRWSPTLLRRMRADGADAIIQRNRVNLLRSFLGLGLSILNQIVFWLTVVYALVSVARGDLPASAVVLIAVLGLPAMNSVSGFFGNATSLYSSVKLAQTFHVIAAGLRRASSVSGALAVPEAREAPQVPADAQTHVDASSSIVCELNDVTMQYVSGAGINNVSLTIESGRSYALVGSIGAGKSTLARLLLRMDTPDSGTVDFPGGGRAATDLRGAVQEFIKPELTLREGLLLGSGGTPISDDELLRVLDSVGFAADQAALDAPVGVRFGGGKPSGGGWQKLAIARSLVQPAQRLWVLDEPVASLDAIAEANLYQQFLSQSNSTAAALVFVSHRFSVVEMVDSVVFLEDGRIAAMGAHADLLRDVPRYRDMYQHYWGIGQGS